MTDAQQGLDHIRQTAEKDLEQQQDKVALACTQAARLVQGLGAVVFLLSIGMLMLHLTGHPDDAQAGVLFPYLLFTGLMLFFVGQQIRTRRPSPSANQLD